MTKTTDTQDVRIYAVPQIDGATRILALTPGDAEWIRRDHAAIDAVRPIMIVDLSASGEAEWPQRASSSPAWLMARDLIDA